jgi:branched-subunit amino acid aminotransferase/4-amino-4-deoxychorismate lyase
MIVFLNGNLFPEADAVVSLNDRGFLLGDRLFETIRVAKGRLFRRAQHLERLVRGADFLKIKLPLAPKEIQKFAGELIAKNKLSDAILRVTLTRAVIPPRARTNLRWR